MKILKVGFSLRNFGGGKGSEEAPDAIERELKNIYCSENGFNKIYFFDRVNINFENIEETNKSIFNAILGKSNLIILGGEHSITYSCFKAFAKGNKNFGLVVFDAHPDVVNNFSPPTQEDYLRVLIEEGMLNKDNVVLIGLRNFHSIEIEYLKANYIKYFDMKRIFDDGVENICDILMEIILKWEKFYLSIDIDAVDPAYAPGTGHIEPGGLTSRELIYFVQRLKKMKNLGIVDIVEVNPSKDINNMTCKLAGKIIKELV